MDANQFRKGLGRLNWELNFDRFCREILECEPRENDIWQMEMWEAWKKLTEAVGRFDNCILQRILDKAHDEYWHNTLEGIAESLIEANR